jgi:Anti-sigma factor NepR
MMSNERKPPPDGVADAQLGDMNREPLAPEVQDAISRKLRAVYRDMVVEPLPDKLQELLDRLGKSETKS